MSNTNPLTIDGITITQVDTWDALHSHYDGQISPQPCYLELAEDGSVCCDVSGEISAVPISVHHDRDLRWTIPCLTQKSANQLMTTARPLLARVHAGRIVEWNGSNMIGCFSDDADEASREIEREIERLDETDCLQVMAAGDWMDGVGTLEAQAESIGITARTTELEPIAERLAAEAKSEGVLLTEIDQYLSELREELGESDQSCLSCKWWNGVSDETTETTDSLPGCIAAGCSIEATFPSPCADWKDAGGECWDEAAGVKYPGHQWLEDGRCSRCGAGE